MIPAPLGRLAYKVAYAGLWLGSLVVRPHTRGVKCVVRCGEELLLVRHSYGPRVWDLPGGFSRRGEPYTATARRELGEELSIGAGADLTEVGELHRSHMGRRETIGVIAVELTERAVEIRGFELRRAAWFRPGALPERRGAVVDDVLALTPGLAAERRG